MTTITRTPTVGELASRSLAAVRILEEHGIDYCCQGRRSLDEACREKGIDPGALISEVSAAEASPDRSARDWTQAPLAELVEHILTAHHFYLRGELPLLERRLAAVLDAHQERHGEMLRALAAVFAALKAELESHMGKEEVILFPFVVRAERMVNSGLWSSPPPFGSVRNPILVMEHEHDSAGRALEKMRALTGGYAPPPEACNTWRALYDGLAALERDLHVHIHLENNILFPRALAMESAGRG
jgi:regulator of cell morphogenesis and NO signaling